MIKFISDKNNSNFVRLWWAQLISQFGDRITQMALIGLSYELSGKQPSAMSLAKLLSFTIIPVFIVGPIAGVFIDRWDRKKTLLICDIARGALVLTIPFIFFYWKTMVPIYTVIFLMFCFSRFYVPAKMSIIPQIVKQENLLTANSMMTTTGMIAFAMGCALGGFLVEWFGARGGFVIDAATFFISASLIFSMTSDLYVSFDRRKIFEHGREIVRIERSFWRELKEGVDYLFRKKEIRFVISILFLLLAAAGAVYVMMIVFVQNAFHSITRHLGVLAVTLGAGLFSGAVLYGKFGKDIPWYKIIFYCLTVAGALMIAFVLGLSLWPNVWLAFILTLALGIVIGPVFIASNTIIHNVAEEQMQGKVFSSLEVVIHLAFMISMLLSSWLSQKIPPALILTGVAVLVTAVGLAGIWRVKIMEQR
ncbi:MAG: MFS transporter [Candidatus Omnitrophota bacterium]